MGDISQAAIFDLLLSLPAFIAAFTIHEFAHAWMANRLGDDTPRRLGRLTLDPLAHLDPFGSIMFVITQLAGRGLGWAKPVPFNPRNFDHPRRDMMLVAVAGPVSNLLQVPVWFAAVFIFRIIAVRTGMIDMYADMAPYSVPSIVLTILTEGIYINIVLAAFNMIPFPPLDGHYILEGLGPPAITDFYNAIRPYGFILLYMISMTHILDTVLLPPIRFASTLVAIATGGLFW